MVPSELSEKRCPPPDQGRYGHEVRTPTAMQPFIPDDTTTIDEAVGQKVVEAARAQLPCEACGLLFGQKTTKGVEILGAEICANTTTSDPCQSFAISPTNWIDSWRMAEESGLEVVGVWHSHPGGTAELSAKDLARAWPEHVQMIAAIESNGAASLHVFRIRSRDRYAEAP